MGTLASCIPGRLAYFEGESLGERYLAAESWESLTAQTPMDDTDFEGTLVLEQLAAIGKVEDFFDAIDSDDIQRATALMRRANVDAPTIATVIRKMEESDGQH